MAETVLIPYEDSRRPELFASFSLESEEPLIFAVEAMVEKALSEDSYLPTWYPLGGRNAAGIVAISHALEGTRWFPHSTKNRLWGVKHADSGRFLAIHNTCERTGLDNGKGHPRFASTRGRNATKSLRDDLQGDLFEVVESISSKGVIRDEESDLNMHLCVFILLETTDLGEQAITVRAELIIGGDCSDVGFSNSLFRIPLDLRGLSSRGKGAGKDVPPESDAIEPFVSIRKRS